MVLPNHHFNKCAAQNHQPTRLTQHHSPMRGPIIWPIKRTYQENNKQLPILLNVLPKNIAPLNSQKNRQLLGHLFSNHSFTLYSHLKMREKGNFQLNCMLIQSFILAKIRAFLTPRNQPIKRANISTRRGNHSICISRSPGCR